ncbi:MAG: hypothetical protein MUO54_14765 [Anaerolineales bacterium]|nr:hypothetical protein [Anaerolineales bacterium]
MFFRKMSGWGIFFRIVMILVLIGGAVAITRGVFYMGYNQGIASDGADLDGSFLFHDGWGTKGYMPHMGYPGGAYMPHRVGFGGSILPFLFLFFGGIFLVKMFMGFAGMGMYYRGNKGGDPEGKGCGMVPPFMHHPYYRHHHRVHCDCGCEDDPEGESKEPVDEGKPADKKS